MNWNYWLPWREYPQEGAEDSERGERVIEGRGPKRVLVNESEQDDQPYGVTD